MAIAACSSETKDSSGPATTPVTTSETTAATSAAITAATTPATTAEAATTTAPPSVAPLAAITPEVLCGPTFGGPVYFAYTNAGTDPVVIDATADNSLTDALQDDEPLVPTVFAPGHVSPAFWAYPSETENPSLTWTVTGSDGVARTATLDASTPECTDELLQSTPTDTRNPTLAFSYTALPGSADPPQQIDLVAAVVNLPPTSICPSGLDPQAPRVWIDIGFPVTETLGATACSSASAPRADESPWR